MGLSTPQCKVWIPLLQLLIGNIMVELRGTFHNHPEPFPLVHLLGNAKTLESLEAVGNVNSFKALLDFEPPYVEYSRPALENARDLQNEAPIILSQVLFYVCKPPRILRQWNRLKQRLLSIYSQAAQSRI